MLTKIQNRRGGFTLVEIMIVVAIIALLAAIAVPSALRARKRSQATSTLETLRLLDGANDQWAIETGQSAGSKAANGSILTVYVKTGTKLYQDLNGTGATDAIGNIITLPAVDTAPLLPTPTYNSLSDVAPATFWGPYYSTAGS
jgi:prepilin-type N-terminal cleavage/methylation domain-containing protein